VRGADQFIQLVHHLLHFPLGGGSLNMEPNDPPTAEDWRALRDKVNELIGALHR